MTPAREGDNRWHLDKSNPPHHPLQPTIKTSHLRVAFLLPCACRETPQIDYVP